MLGNHMRRIWEKSLMTLRKLKTKLASTNKLAMAHTGPYDMKGGIKKVQYAMCSGLIVKQWHVYDGAHQCCPCFTCANFCIWILFNSTSREKQYCVPN